MITLDDFADRLQKAKRGHDYVLGLCIFHDDINNPSLVVYERTRHFECFACGARGSWDFLLDTISGAYHGHAIATVDRTPARYKRPNWYVEDKWGGLAEYTRRSHDALVALSQTHWYLEDRGIIRSIKDCRLGWDRGWLVIPCISELGEVEGCVARAYPHVQKKLGMRFDMPRGQKPLLYVPSHSQWRESDAVFIVFGVIDAISVALAGYGVASPTAGKSSVRPVDLDEVRKPIVVVPDLRESAAAYALAARLDWRGRVYAPNYLENEKDPNDILVNRGIDGLREELNNAVASR